MLALPSLLALAAPGLLPLAARAQSDQVTLSAFPYLFSHLSPLITYSPEDAWTHNAWGSNTSSPSAKTSFYAQGSLLIVNGRFEGDATWSADPKFEGDPPPTQQGELRGNDSSGNQEMLAVDRGNRNLQQRLVTINNGPGEGAMMSVTRVQQFTYLPTFGGSRAVNVTRVSAVESDGDSNPFFIPSSPSSWSVNSTTAPNAARSAYAGNSSNPLIPSVWYADQFPSPFITNSTLSTSSANEPLRFPIPRNTAFVQWYGSVGPDHGAFEIRLTPTGDTKPNFAFAKDKYAASAQRSVESGMELLMVAYTDPRVTYDAEIVLVQEGKKLDVNGMYMSTYLADPQQLGTADFVQTFNQRNAAGTRAGRGAGTTMGLALAGTLIASFCL